MNKDLLEYGPVSLQSVKPGYVIETRRLSVRSRREIQLKHGESQVEPNWPSAAPTQDDAADNIDRYAVQLGSSSSEMDACMVKDFESSVGVVYINVCGSDAIPASRIPLAKNSYADPLTNDEADAMKLIADAEEREDRLSGADVPATTMAFDREQDAEEHHELDSIAARLSLASPSLRTELADLQQSMSEEKQQRVSKDLNSLGLLGFRSAVDQQSLPVLHYFVCGERGITKDGKATVYDVAVNQEVLDKSLFADRNGLVGIFFFLLF